MKNTVSRNTLTSPLHNEEAVDAATGGMLTSVEKARCRLRGIRLNDWQQAGYFLNTPISNHHIILPGHCKAVLEALLA